MAALVKVENEDELSSSGGLVFYLPMHPAFAPNYLMAQTQVQKKVEGKWVVPFTFILKSIKINSYCLTTRRKARLPIASVSWRK